MFCNGDDTYSKNDRFKNNSRFLWRTLNAQNAYPHRAGTSAV